ncbi:uncharacterized protein [Asterias amurensis]|uniref:uncharacterized protein isoform X3 n=1 Tax=Asterias amurensis TaxID=7602 RepID=UPI003AB6B07B
MEKYTAEIFRLTIVLVLAVACILGQTATTDVAGTEITTAPTAEMTAEPETKTAGTHTYGPTVKRTEAGAVTEAITTNPVTKSNDQREFVGTLKITKLGDKVANFTDDLKDPKSEPFKKSSTIVCDALKIAAKDDSIGEVEDCSITSFKAGSIVADFSLKFNADTKFTAAQLQEKLVESFNSSLDTGITLDVTSITLEEKTGEEKAPAGLSTGAIAGIAVGAAVGGLLLIVVLVLVIMKCAGGSSKVSGSDQDLRPAAPPGDAEVDRSDGVLRA